MTQFQWGHVWGQKSTDSNPEKQIIESGLYNEWLKKRIWSVIGRFLHQYREEQPNYIRIIKYKQTYLFHNKLSQREGSFDRPKHKEENILQLYAQ